MDKFMSYDFDIQKITFVDSVPAGMNPHIHINRPNHGIAFHTAGEKEYIFSDGTRRIVRPFDIIYLPKYSDYTVYPIIPGECYAINFDTAEDITFCPFTVHAKNHMIYTGYFRNAQTALRQKKQGYMMKCKAELYNVICTIQQEYNDGYMPKSSQNLIAPALEYIHNNYTAELLNIENLAEMCNITSAYFRKIFRQFYGTSPISYINNLKISRAKELIDSGMYSISESALQSGYSDMSHFSREFKKAIGVSPSQYKNNKNRDKN